VVIKKLSVLLKINLKKSHTILPKGNKWFSRKEVEILWKKGDCNKCHSYITLSDYKINEQIVAYSEEI
jgi:hypothetical protein